MSFDFGDHERAVRYGKRGRKALTMQMQYCIQGEYVHMAQIAARINCTIDAAYKRYQREQAKPGPVTWDGMKEARGK